MDKIHSITFCFISVLQHIKTETNMHFKPTGVTVLTLCLHLYQVNHEESIDFFLANTQKIKMATVPNPMSMQQAPSNTVKAKNSTF